MNEPVTIDVYSDVVCPWCYVGKRRLERALSSLSVRTNVRWRPFELNPTLPPEGMDRVAYLEAKFGSVDAFLRLEEHVKRAGESEGISFAFENVVRTPNTFMAHRLIWYAGREGVQDRIVDALFKGYFEQGADIGSRSVLARLAESVGVQAASFLATDEGAAEVRAEEAAGHRLGIRAVPYFVLSNAYGISGAQPAEVLIDAIERIAAQPTEHVPNRK